MAAIQMLGDLHWSEINKSLYLLHRNCTQKLYTETSLRVSEYRQIVIQKSRGSILTVTQDMSTCSSPGYCSYWCLLSTLLHTGSTLGTPRIVYHRKDSHLHTTQNMAKNRVFILSLNWVCTRKPLLLPNSHATFSKQLWHI